MLRSAALLFVLGIALGLWLGFDPQAHAQVVRFWDQMRAAYASLQTKTSVTIHNSTAGTKTSQPAGSSTTTTSNVWKQLSSIFTSLWNSLHGLWLEISTKLKLNRT